MEKAKAEATGARQALDEASRLQEQLAGDKSRLEAEVERLKAEAAKVVEAQQALAEADQQRGKLADDKGQLQAEVERLKALVATAEETRQGETRRHEEAVKAAEDKDAELKAALAKVADLEKVLEERDRTIAGSGAVRCSKRSTWKSPSPVSAFLEFCCCRVGTPALLP